MQNPYDHALKLLARTYPEVFMQLRFPGQTIQLLGTVANVELALEIDRIDFLHEIALNGERRFLHFDFQLKFETDNPRRFHVYNGMLTELNKPTPVITVPVYLQPREKEIPAQYEVKIGETIIHRFTYTPLKLWDYVDQIRSGELYAFAPLLPLIVKPMDEALLIEERQLILTHEPNLARQNTLLTTAILIAAQAEIFNSDFLWDLFKEDKMDFDNPVIAKLFDRHFGQKLAEETQKKVAEETQKIEHLLEQKFERELTLVTHQVAEAEAARREAEAEVEAARREAEAEAANQWQLLMLKVLDHRFQSVPVALIVLLQAVTPDQRSQVADLILDAPDVGQCLQGLRQLQSSKS